MNKQPFYRFSSKLVTRTLQVHAIGLTKGRNENNLLAGNYEGITFPVQFKQEYGKRLEDVLNTGCAYFYIISDKMKTVLEDNQLTGWQTFPIQIFDKKGNEIHGYHGFSTLGRSGTKDYTKSEIIEKQHIADGPFWKYYKGYQIDLGSWDGSDFFLPQGYRGTIVTERAAEAMKKAKLTNVVLENIADIEIDDSTMELAIQKGSVII
jgi:hypothetical protein